MLVRRVLKNLELSSRKSGVGCLGILCFALVAPIYAQEGSAPTDDEQPAVEKPAAGKPAAGKPAAGKPVREKTKREKLSREKRVREKRDKAEQLTKLEEALEQEDVFQAQELIQLFSESDIKKSPRLLVAQALIAKTLYRTDEAYELLRMALKLDENFAPAQFETALILMEKKEWADAEVLMRLAGASEGLGRQRQLMVPYYLGVIAFETGRLFSARNSFSQLGWNESLDPALEQSVGAFLSKIAGQRPWAVIAPLSVQYESNSLGLERGAALPSEFSRRDGFQVIGGFFGSLAGLGGGQPGAGPLGLALRLFTVQHLRKEFHSLNVVFTEAEASWSHVLGQSLGVFRTAVSGQLIRAGNKAVSSSAGLKLSMLQTELSTAYENDLLKDSEVDRSAVSVRLYREQEISKNRRVSFSLPIDAGAKLGVRRSPGEKRFDGALIPTFTWTPSRRTNLKFSEKVSFERVLAREGASVTLLKSSPAFALSFTLQPYLILSTSTSYDWQKNMTTQAIVQRGVVATSLLGIL